MSSQTTKTNNDERFIGLKVNLRIESMPSKEIINVLELYGGNGILWSKVKKQTGRNINCLGIDNQKYRRIQLQGDNLKFIEILDLTKFDIIDADAYGMPIKQLEKIFDKEYKGVIHCTFIQTGMGGISHKMLDILGYSKVMIKKAPTLFYKNGFEKFKQYLAIKGVNKIIYFSSKKKTYLYFRT